MTRSARDGITKFPDAESQAALRFLVLCLAPGVQVDGAHGDAENVGGDKTELRGSDGNDADDNAVDRGERPAFPVAASHQHGGCDGQNTRKIIKP